MKARGRFSLVAILFSLCCATGADELFRVSFSGRCFPSDGTNGLTTRLSGTDLIRRCVGSDVTKREIRRNFRLAYNASADSLQVIRLTDGSAMCDVFRFETSASALKSNRLERLAFILEPEDGRFVGTAVFIERPLTNTASGALRSRITARLQFAREQIATNSVAANATSAGTNSVATTNVTTVATNQSGSELAPGSFAQATALAAANDNIQVCTATFSTGRLFGLLSTAPSQQISLSETNQTSFETTNQTSTATNRLGLTTNITTVAETNITTVPAPPPPP